MSKSAHTPKKITNKQTTDSQLEIDYKESPTHTTKEHKSSIVMVKDSNARSEA
jgi:hypothetical protein